MDSPFARDVIAGLSARPKKLSSKYFYDEQGSRLFQEIMALDEYYLTGSEYEVLSTNKAAMLALFGSKMAVSSLSNESTWAEDEKFDLIEFGAGDGLKVKILLQHFLEKGAHFQYFPIDISKEALDGLVNDLRQNLPDLQTEPVLGEYFGALGMLKERSQTRKVVLFLGANIGNFNEEEAVKFLSQLRANLNPDDLVMIGFDLKKEPSRILAAYNDAKGVTREFNLNLLRRINRELGGDFQLDSFQHYPTYDPQSGEARSYLISTKEQTVRVAASGASFHFDAWEPIHVEISRKYDWSTIVRLAERSGFVICQNFYDSSRGFVDSVWGLQTMTSH